MYDSDPQRAMGTDEGTTMNDCTSCCEAHPRPRGLVICFHACRDDEEDECGGCAQEGADSHDSDSSVFGPAN